MAGRPTERKHVTLAALAAGFALATGFMASASGAPVRGGLCSDDAQEATLEVPKGELSATLVNHELEGSAVSEKVDALSADQLLTPSAAAEIREVFGDSETEQADAADADADDAVIMNTRVPGYSDDELARFKRQMFRKDI